MVSVNDSEVLANSIEENLYIRTLDDFRIDFENGVLFFLNELRDKYSEYLDSEYFEYMSPYFDKLCSRYHINNLRFNVNSEKENREVDDILKIIKRAKKAVDYSYLDVADFYYKRPDYFLGFRIDKNFAIIMKSILEEYNHKIPEKIINESDKFPIFEETSLNKSNIAGEFIDELKESIDKMILKVYDYLVETDKKEIFSRKMYLLKNDFLEIGDKYHKLEFGVSFRNMDPIDRRDYFLDEVAANVFRVKEIFMS